LFFFLIFPSKFSPLEALSTGWTTYKEENDGNQSEMLTDIQVDSSQLPLVMNESCQYSWRENGILTFQARRILNLHV
jgi:hypothetical protein